MNQALTRLSAAVRRRVFVSKCFVRQFRWRGIQTQNRISRYRVYYSRLLGGSQSVDAERKLR
jgi:hypothetical protein